VARVNWWVVGGFVAAVAGIAGMIAGGPCGGPAIFISMTALAIIIWSNDERTGAPK
jgi:hypothetical protein